MKNKYIAEDYSDAVKEWIDGGNTGVSPSFALFKPLSLGIIEIQHPVLKEATLRKFNDGSLFMRYVIDNHRMLLSFPSELEFRKQIAPNFPKLPWE